MKAIIKTAKLKDVCKIEKGKIGITKAIEGEYPLVVTAEERSSHNEWHFDEPATIVPLVSSTGHGHASIKRLHYAEGKYAVGNILATLIPKDHDYLSAKYLYVYLTINKEELLVSQMTGAANVSLTLTKLKEVEIEIPEYETQLEIIEKFKQSQEFKNRMSRQIEDRGEMTYMLRQQILQEAIVGRLSEKWRKENPNIESANILLEKIKAEKEKLVKYGKIKKQKALPPITDDEKPFELPEGWAWCRFQDITTVITCGIASTPKYKKDGRIFLSAKNVKPYRFMPEDHKFVDEETYQKIILNSKPEINDILLTRVGAGIGEAAIIDQNIDFAFYVSLTLIKPVHKYTISEYILHFLNSPEGIKNAISYTTGKGGSQGNLNVNRVRPLLIPLPPIEEQLYLSDRIKYLQEKFDRVLELNTQNTETINLLNQVLLKEVFEE